MRVGQRCRIGNLDVDDSTLRFVGDNGFPTDIQIAVGFTTAPGALFSLDNSVLRGDYLDASGDSVVGLFSEGSSWPGAPLATPPE